MMMINNNDDNDNHDNGDDDDDNDDDKNDNDDDNDDNDDDNDDANREITTTWYYVNSRKHIDLENIRVPDGIWTHNPPWSSRMLYHWATGDSGVSKGQIVGSDWNRFMWLHG